MIDALQPALAALLAEPENPAERFRRGAGQGGSHHCQSKQSRRRTRVLSQQR